MKMTIIGSMKFYGKYLRLKKQLEENGHEIIIPLPYGEYETEATKLGAMKKFNDNLEKSDAILIANFDIDEKPNYIGVNSLMEIGMAFNRDKKIFILNEIPEDCKDELEAIGVITLKGDLNKI